MESAICLSECACLACSRNCCHSQLFFQHASFRNTSYSKPAKMTATVTTRIVTAAVASIAHALFMLGVLS